MRAITAAIILSLAVSTAASAQNLQTRECNASNIAFVEEAIGKMQDSKQKTTASDELGEAKKATAEGRDDECKDHLLKATLQTK